MLTELHIRDFAIIEDLQLTFDPGFSALTGETGAGKSIIVDAVSLVLGSRADTTFVRAGSDRAIVEATFQLHQAIHPAVNAILEREGLEGDDPDLLLLGREIRANGRSICRVNGRVVTLTILREITEGLVDIHGQSEHLSLLRPRSHVDLLDRFGNLWPLRAEVTALVDEVRAVQRELTDLITHEQELAHRTDLLRFQIDEISSATLQAGEEEKLLAERVRLSNAELLAALIGEARLALEGSGDETLPAAMDLLGEATRALGRLARVDPALEPQLQAIETITYQVEELSQALRDYEEQVEYNPHRLEQVEERLALIHRLERKYGATIPDVLAYADRATQELETIAHSEERVTELQRREEHLLAELARRAVALSLKRRQAAQQLSRQIETELADLRMEGARFDVDFAWRADTSGLPVTEALLAELLPDQPATPREVLSAGHWAFDRTGIDRVEFLVSPNPGEPLKPLVRIASGGETSRLMLALKTVLSRADETPTLIFDEIDQGIGGRVGATVGEKLWRLTTGPDGIRHQVLCVTHLPQLAAFGDVHFHIEKQVTSGGAEERTTTHVRQLTGTARVEELAQMLGGSGEAARRSAEEILAQATEYKRSA